MNRKVIGMYLKQLREQKKLTQEQLASIFSEEYGISISVHAISEWENGNTLPSGENLEILAEIYDKTLDELLDGKDRVDVNYDDIYFRNIGGGTKRRFPNSLLLIKRNQLVRIVIKFKEYIEKTIDKIITNEENNEFKYLFEKFYDFTYYGKSLLKDNQDVSFTSFLFLIRKTANELIDNSFEEKYWEIQKIFSIKEDLIRIFRIDIADINDKEKSYVKDLFIAFESWEKDAMLAFFQEKEPLLSTPDSNGSKRLQEYIDKNGDYDKDKFYKDCMRTLVENGACINKTFFKKAEMLEKKIEIIHTLEELHNMYYEPLLLRTLNDKEEYEYHKVENNDFNRFLLDVDEFYSITVGELTRAGLTMAEIYYKFLLPDEVGDDIYLRIAKSKNIDTNRDKKLWMADLNVTRYGLFSERDLFKKQVKRTIENKKLYEELHIKLKKGEKYYIDRIEKKSSLEISMETMIERKNKMTYNQYLNSREEELTKEMLVDLDKLKFDELRKKYFMKEE